MRGIFFEDVKACAEPFASLEEGMAFVASLGLDGFQFGDYEIAAEGEVRLRDALQRHGLRAHVIHTFATLLSPDPTVHARGLEAARATVELAARMECPYVMLAPQPRTDVADEADRERAWAQMAEDIRTLTALADPLGVSLCIENFSTERLPYGRIEDLIRFCETVPTLTYTFDSGNFVCTRWDPFTAYEAMRPYTALLHVKDFAPCATGEGFLCDDGGYVGGLPFGTGPFPMEAFLRLCAADGFENRFIIEHNFAATREDLRRAAALVLRYLA